MFTFSICWSQIDKRGLASAVLPLHADDVPGADREVHIAQRLWAGGIAEGHAGCGDAGELGEHGSAVAFMPAMPFAVYFFAALFRQNQRIGPVIIDFA